MAKKEKKEQGGSSKTIIIVVIAIIVGFLIVAGTVFACFMMLNGNKESGEEQAAVETKIDEFSVPLEEFLLNLKDENKARYLKVSVALGGDLTNVELKAEVEGATSQIRDIILKTLRSKTTADIVNTESLKEELKTNINGILTKGQLMNVYFTDLIVQ